MNNMQTVKNRTYRPYERYDSSASRRSTRPQSTSGGNGRTSRAGTASVSVKSSRTSRPQAASSYDRNSRRREWEYEEYIDGNTVRKTQLETLLEEDPKKQLHLRARKNREKAVHMNFGYVAFLVGALVLMGVILISYINLRSEITSSIKRISRMESELYSLQQENDEYETRINSSVNLEDVRRIAIEELGMKYASEGQIVNVEGGSDDYVRKYAEIP